MPLPGPLQTVTVQGRWVSPMDGTPLAGTVTLAAVNNAISPAGDVLLTTQPETRTLDSSGSATWAGVLCSDSTGLSEPVVYRVTVNGRGYSHTGLLQLLAASAVGGAIQLGDVVEAETPPQVATYVLKTGDVITGATTINTAGNADPEALPGGYGISTAPTGLVVASSYASDDVVGGTDSTGRIHLYSYQRANTYSLGEVLRIFGMRKDSKQMLAWYMPTLGYDGNRDPAAGTSWTPVTWIGSHWESNAHDGNHKHFEIEVPDTNGALQGRLEVLFGPPGDETIGLNRTKILTNLTDFVVRCSGTNTVDGSTMQQVLRLSAAAGLEKALEFANDTDGVNRRWKFRVTNETESGSNAGANFQLVRYDDAGTLVDSPIVVSRSTGQVAFGGAGGTAAGVTATRSVNGVVVSASLTAAGGTSSVFLATAPTTAKALQSLVSGDSSARFSAGIDGRLEWGSGAATRDTNLYRFAADTLKTDDALVVTGSVTAARVITPPVTLTDAATVATDASLSSHFRVTLAGNRTLGNPANPVDGQRVTWELIQDATGSRTITLDSKFGLGTDIASVTLTTTATKRDFLTAVYNGVSDKWYVIDFRKGY